MAIDSAKAAKAAQAMAEQESEVGHLFGRFFGGLADVLNANTVRTAREFTRQQLGTKEGQAALALANEFDDATGHLLSRGTRIVAGLITPHLDEIEAKGRAARKGPAPEIKVRPVSPRK